MPPLVPSTVAELRMVGELHGQQCINVWHLGSAETFVDFDTWQSALTILAQNMLDCAIELLLPAVTSDYRLIRAEAKMVYPTVTDYFVSSADTSAVGELGPTSVSFASTLVNLRSGRDGKRGRGRKFLPPAGEANITASELDQPTLIAITAFLACLAGKFIGGSPTTPWRLGVLSRSTLGGITGNYPAAFKELVQMTPSTEVACLRSRKAGKGS